MIANYDAFLAILGGIMLAQTFATSYLVAFLALCTTQLCSFIASKQGYRFVTAKELNYRFIESFIIKYMLIFIISLACSFIIPFFFYLAISYRQSLGFTTILWPIAQYFQYCYIFCAIFILRLGLLGHFITAPKILADGQSAEAAVSKGGLFACLFKNSLFLFLTLGLPILYLNMISFKEGHHWGAKIGKILAQIVSQTA